MTIGFTAPVAVTGRAGFHGTTMTTSRSTRTAVPTTKMSIADEYIAIAAVKDGKQAGSPFGVYIPQCTEGTASSNSAYSKRVATLSREFRLRQASVSQKYADLFATRREAMCLSKGMHYAESSAVNFPSAAASKVRAEREVALACDRYFGAPEDVAAAYMHRCVKNQYVQQLTCPTGVYGTACADGATFEAAETSRTAALAVEYAAGMIPLNRQAAMMYNAPAYAYAVSRGCSYEDAQFKEFPKMAAGIQGLTTGAYSASVGGAAQMGSRAVAQLGKAVSLAEKLAGDNFDALFPASDIRPAVKKDRPFWSKVEGTVKSYAYMSGAAVEYGKSFSDDKFDDSGSYQDSWSPGWVPTSTTSKNYV